MTITAAQPEQERERLIRDYVRNQEYSGFETQADGVNHLAFVAHDLDKTIEFYTKIVGLKLLRVRPLDGDPQSTMVFFDLGRGEFLAFLRLKDVSRSAEVGIGAVDHFAVTITREQYDGFKKRADNAGIQYNTISHEILDSISALDPNGLRVELSVWNIEPEEMRQK